jgi:mannose-6-phosphate isomerase-like protein (cupin superfamily)
MKCNIDDIGGKIVKNNETYIVIDNTVLDNLVVSKTILKPGKETTGHKHEGQEEVYQFIYGSGKMQIDDSVFNVFSGDIVLITDGAYHKVFNGSTIENLVFVCVFDGKRSH